MVTSADQPTPLPFPAASASLPDPSLVELQAPPVAAPKRRRGLLLVGAAILAAAAVGVGVFVATRSEDDSARPALKYSLDAAAANAEVATNVEYEMTMTMPNVGTTTATARLDVAQRLMAMDMEFPQVGAVSAVIDLNAAMMFMEADKLGAPVDTKYVAISFDIIPGITEMLQESAGNNPLDVAKAFAQAKATEDLGEDEVNGVVCGHFRLTLDMKAQLAAYPSLADAVAESGADFPDEITEDVWVTADNQLRRVSFSYLMNGQTVAMDMIFTAIGADMEPIVVPSQDDYTDITSMLSGA